MSVNDQEGQPSEVTIATPADGERVKISKTSRQVGFHPRYVTLAREVTGGTVTRTYYDKLVVLLKADVATLLTNGEVVLNGITWKVTGDKGEYFQN
jgi:hypothetical protein